jgi:hypothetical protein
MRIIVALAIAAVGVAYAAHVQATVTHPLDFDHLYMAARFLLERRDPYRLIGPGREYDWPFPYFLYPLTTAVFFAPLTVFSIPTARLLFAGLSATLYLYALGLQPGSRWRYVTALSKPFQATMITGQSSFLLASMVMFPAVAALAAVKPNIGAAVVGSSFSSRSFRFAVVGGLVLLATSLALQPNWPMEWLGAMREDPFRSSAVMRPGGFFLLLAALRWRRPEARLLFALSVVPQTLGMYDALLLFWIPRRASEYVALVALSHFAFLMVYNDGSIHRINDFVFAMGTSIVHWLYLPTLAMVLLRPNTGTVPRWIERVSGNLPPWLRGSTQAALPSLS